MSQPLLASSRPSSERSDDLAIAEEDALLAGSLAARDRRRYGWKFWREVGLFAWAMMATIGIVVLAVLYQYPTAGHGRGAGDGDDDRSRHPTGKRNVIFMVSDGMGPTSLSLTRSFMQSRDHLAPSDALFLDRYHLGSSRTRSTSSLITDSAAGATAFSCGQKSYNGAISVLPDHTPCGTVLEAAKDAGYLTGLVVTTRITDATPACFAAHAHQRAEEDLIAEQEVGHHPLGRVVDLILGGGRCHFLPNSTAGSCRADDKDVVALAKTNGFHYIDDRASFDRLEHGDAVELPLLGLLAESDIPYEVDRRFVADQYPSLDEMTQTALRALTKATEGREHGFFLMVEGSRIDHAGHGNDPVAQVHEVLAYDQAFQTVMKYLDESKTEGVLVSTSDHETGGLATAKQLHDAYPEYLWYPDVLVNATSSAEHLGGLLDARLDAKPDREPLKKFINDDLLQKGLGIHDASDEEMQTLIEHPRGTAYAFADMISRRAQVGWSTHGHSAADVSIFGSKGARSLAGNHENTEIGIFLRNYLDLDLGPITKKLRDASPAVVHESAGTDDNQRGSWLGSLPESGRKLDSFDAYHGEFKH
ncbi:MAG: hypothetical protein M1826_004904 [Phylliscum demangeonii]|nr:MAG: hypothetical protein M1826_004904 [Phylliscum demangeonii]